MGTMDFPVNLASSTMPSFTLYRGPLGPSGVIATSQPSRKLFIISRIDETVPLRKEPRMEPSRKNAITLAISSPSRCLLMSTFPLPLIFANGIINNLPCQKQKMKFSPLFHPSITFSLFTCRILIVIRKSLRNKKIRGGKTLTMRKDLILLFILGPFSEFNDFFDVFIPKLKVIEVFVGAFSFNELGMRTFLDNCSAIDNNNPVSIHHG